MIGRVLRAVLGGQRNRKANNAWRAYHRRESEVWAIEKGHLERELQKARQLLEDQSHNANRTLDARNRDILVLRAELQAIRRQTVWRDGFEAGQRARHDGNEDCREMAEATTEVVRLELAAERAETARLREELDCGQDGVCAKPPGCRRHWEERNRELRAELDVALSRRDEADRKLESARAELARVRSGLNGIAAEWEDNDEECALLEAASVIRRFTRGLATPPAPVSLAEQHDIREADVFALMRVPGDESEDK